MVSPIRYQFLTEFRHQGTQFKSAPARIAKIKSTLTTLIGLGFFDFFGFGGGADAAPLIIFVVCGPIATQFCTGIDNQSISSNMEKLHKINDVIIVRKLAEKTVTRA